METRFADRGGEENKVNHEILKGSPYERLLDHMVGEEVISLAERAEYLSRHLAAQAEAEDFQKLDTRDQFAQLQEARGGRTVLESLRNLVAKVRPH